MSEVAVVVDPGTVAVEVDVSVVEVLVDVQSVEVVVDAQTVDVVVDVASIDVVVSATAPRGQVGDLPTATTAVALTRGNLVTLNASSQLVLATAVFAAGRWDVVATAAADALALTTVGLNVDSLFRVPMLFDTPPPASANGSHVFLSATPGVATLTPPTTAGNAIFLLGTLAGADGAEAAPLAHFRPQFIAYKPA